jgi:hypothetical protein
VRKVKDFVGNFSEWAVEPVTSEIQDVTLLSSCAFDDAPNSALIHPNDVLIRQNSVLKRSCLIHRNALSEPSRSGFNPRPSQMPNNRSGFFQRIASFSF